MEREGYKKTEAEYSQGSASVDPSEESIRSETIVPQNDFKVKAESTADADHEADTELEANEEPKSVGDHEADPMTDKATEHKPGAEPVEGIEPPERVKLTESVRSTDGKELEGNAESMKVVESNAKAGSETVKNPEKQTRPEADTKTAGEPKAKSIDTSITLSLIDAKKRMKKSFPFRKEISSVEALREAVKYDHVVGQFRNKEGGSDGKIVGYRNSKYFDWTNTIVLRIDNKHHAPTESEPAPNEWIPPEDVVEGFPDVDFWLVYDSTKVAEVDGKFIPETYEVYFGVENITNVKAVAGIMKMAQDLFPAFNEADMDVCRVIPGIEHAEVKHLKGTLTLTEYMRDYYPIPANIPNTEAVKALEFHASRILKQFGDTEKADKTFEKVTASCETKLANKVKGTIWSNAKKFYHEVIEKSPDYDAPEYYDVLDSLNDSKEVTSKVIKGILHRLGIGIRYNEITGLTEISDMPSQYSAFNAANLLPVLLMDYLKEHDRRTSRQSIDDDLALIADENRYNPVQILISQTDYDGEDRIKVVNEILGITSDRERIYLRKWLHQCIAMAYNDDRHPYGADGVLVLQGDQGAGKTCFFAWLTGDSTLFAEGVSIDMTSKDSIIQSTAVWIAELGELDSTLKKEQSALKAFLTARTDTYRVPYGRAYVKKTRRTSFCATVNPYEFLSDETGSRRFWTIHVEHIDLERMKKLDKGWIRQLWAQVYHECYLPDPQGFRLTREERKALEGANQMFAKPILGEIEVKDKLDWDAHYDHWNWVKISDLMNDADIKGTSSVQIGKVVAMLAKKNWKIKSKTVHGVKSYYLPPIIKRYSKAASVDLRDNFKVPED